MLSSDVCALSQRFVDKVSRRDPSSDRVRCRPHGRNRLAFVESQAFKLTRFFLIERADRQVAGELTGTPVPLCHSRFQALTISRHNPPAPPCG